MGNASIKVSFIIVHWNRHEDVLQTIHYLSKLRGPRFEIIVVDDGSTDNSQSCLAAVEFIKLICLESNLGPAEARNVGIAEASGEYLVFLDSDAFLSKRGLESLVERMDRDPTLGVIGCRIVNYYTRRLDQWIYPCRPETHEHREFETYSFSAAGAMARSEVCRKAGLFWGDLGIYNEEVDLSIRILQAGYRIIYFPQVAVYHQVSERGRKGAALYWRNQIRNWIWIFYRYYPAAVRWRKITLYVLVYLAKGVWNLRLAACLSGIVEGLQAFQIIGQYQDKLSRDELRRLESLNRRSPFRLAPRMALTRGDGGSDY
jgi:GT2 family glycosyltransferase